eukprot:12885424-Alexandrium_andersonii.AAC.1
MRRRGLGSSWRRPGQLNEACDAHGDAGASPPSPYGVSGDASDSPEAAGAASSTPHGASGDAFWAHWVAG